MLNDLTSLSTYFATRRSCRPRDIIAPGPDEQTLEDIVSLALRTPDHGKLQPWRIVHVQAEHRQILAEQLKTEYQREKPDAGKLELETMERLAHFAPTLLIVLHVPRESAKIPLWEQQLSTGAFTMNLLHAAHIKGFVGGWITGWPAFNAKVRDLFGREPERIAGLVYLGTAQKPLDERPRPMRSDVLSDWQPPT